MVYFNVVRYNHNVNLLDITKKFSNCKAYQLLEQDLIKTFDYVEPEAQNRGTYSHRYYEIILRAGTEFENVCKQILKENRLIGKVSKQTTIKDYFLIIKEFELCKYRFSSPLLSDWEDPVLKGSNVSPYIIFGGCKTYSDVKEICKNKDYNHWYQIYNKVKHNRKSNFNLANLENAILSVVGLGILLCSQYGMDTFDPYKEVVFYHTDSNNNDFIAQTIWKVSHPESMPTPTF